MSDDKAGWERPTAAEPLAIDEITRLLAPWLHGRRVLGAELLPGGLMNRNVCLHLAGTPSVCVLRLYDRDPLACGREVAVLRLLRGQVPVPEVLYLRPAASDSAPPHAVLSYVDGISLYELRQRRDADALADACYDAGRALARIAAYRFPAVGVLTSTLDVDSSFMRGPVTNVGLVAELMEAPAFQRRVDADLQARILAFVEAYEPRIREVKGSPTLVHGDFNARNILVHRTLHGWRVSAVLDWEFALAASPFIDIGNFLRYHRPTRRRYEPHFSRGLVDGGLSLPDDWLTIARAMDLPACCELIGRASTPPPAVEEMKALVADVVTRHG